MFSISSFANFNADLLSMECDVPSVTFQTKWLYVRFACFQPCERAAIVCCVVLCLLAFAPPLRHAPARNLMMAG